MITSITYYGQVVDNVLKIHGRKSFDKDLTLFNGKSVEVVVKKKKKTRSLPQNRFYFGCVIPILQDAINKLGNRYTSSQVHEMMKYKFLREDVPLDGGTFIERVKSTTELTTTGFMEYLMDISKWAAEYLYITIPEPGEQMEIALT